MNAAQHSSLFCSVGRDHSNIRQTKHGRVADSNQAILLLLPNTMQGVTHDKQAVQQTRRLKSGKGRIPPPDAPLSANDTSRQRQQVAGAFAHATAR